MDQVSVILPTYNQGDFIFNSVKSVLKQSHTNIECIVVDGGSTDGTRAILEKFDDNRLKTIYHEQPQGPSNARNVGIDAATGSYILFLDSDDYLYRNAVEVLVKNLTEQPPDCVGICTSFQVVNHVTKHKSIRKVPDGKITKSDLAERNVIGGPSCTMYRPEALDQVNGFDETFSSREDIDMYLRLLSEHHMLGIDKILYIRNNHESQLTNNDEQTVKGQRQLLERHSRKLNSHNQAVRYYIIARAEARLGKPVVARLAVQKAIRKYPYQYKYYVLYILLLLFGIQGYRMGSVAMQRLQTMVK